MQNHSLPSRAFSEAENPRCESWLRLCSLGNESVSGHDPRACTLYCQVATGVCSELTGNTAPPANFRAMRFLDKYDLQEPITGGPIKMYEALEPDTGLRRLIQILEWKEAPAEVSTLQVLEHFRQTAPDPPGIILDAGRVEKTNQIYLVTSFPADPLAVQRWVNAYRARSGTAASEPRPVSPEPAALQSATPTTSPARESTDRAQPWTRHQPGAFTKEFLALLDGSYKIASTPPPVPPQAETTKEPGAFTREFLSLSSSAAQEDQQDKAPVGSPTGASGLFEDVRQGPATSASVPPVPEPMVDKRTGEFTRYFRGYSEAPSVRPAPSFSPTSDVLGTRAPKPEGGQDSPGEITKLLKADIAAPSEVQGEPPAGFGLGSGTSPQSPRFAPDPVPRQPTPLRDLSASRELAPPAKPSFEPAWTEQTTRTTPRSVSLGTPSPRPPVASQPTPGNSLEPAWRKEEKSGTTQLITPPGVQQPSPEPVSRGPSEFTRIISATSVPGGSPPPPSPSPAMAPPIQVPSVPVHIPSMTAPPVAVPVPAAPYVPPVPNLAAMHTPPTPAPVPPPVPQPAPKLVSYLPLIITLNVLLIVAVAIVLYFALKSHH